MLFWTDQARKYKLQVSEIDEEFTFYLYFSFEIIWKHNYRGATIESPANDIHVVEMTQTKQQN